MSIVLYVRFTEVVTRKSLMLGYIFYIIWVMVINIERLRFHMVI